MLRVRAYSGRVICTIDPAERKIDNKGRILDDLAVIAGLYLRVPATRISIHPVEGCEQTPLTPCMTWADCEHVLDATDYELMAVVRHYRDGGVLELSMAIKAERWDKVHSLLEDFVDPNSVIRDDAGYGRCSPLPWPSPHTPILGVLASQRRSSRPTPMSTANTSKRVRWWQLAKVKTHEWPASLFTKALM